MIIGFSRTRPWLAPLALLVGALAMLFDEVKLLFTSWRLILIQVLPAMWIWTAMFDLEVHLLRGRAFHALTGPAIVIPLVIGVPLQAVATGAVKTVKMSAVLVSGHSPGNLAITSVVSPPGPDLWVPGAGIRSARAGGPGGPLRCDASSPACGRCS
jgi:hypothetical protein